MFVKWMAPLLVFLLVPPPASRARDFLTAGEVESIQGAPGIDARVNLYMDAAERRLRSAAERVTGGESDEGDPLEFLTAEQMLEDYLRILRSVMFAVDDAFQEPKRAKGDISTALRRLKGRTGELLKRLRDLRRLSEEKQKEALWNLVNQADEITEAARAGAEEGLSILRAQRSR
ncbi:MAG: hypothetical protein QM330_03365 [Acidobacteriota bacterium]|jgi:hypothetical protein|nr:hypothetical protein [Acidobacteriota bacterium]NLT33630.1 hypothetical protein [Acidobacteriota bacterium]